MTKLLDKLRNKDIAGPADDVINSLINNPDDWEFTSEGYYWRCPYQYTYTNKEKEYSFTMNDDMTKVMYETPIAHTCEAKTGQEIITFLKKIWNNNDYTNDEFMKDFVDSESNFSSVSLVKDDIDIIPFKLWCYKNLTGKYYVNLNEIRRDKVIEIKDEDKRTEYMNEEYHKSKHDNYIIWCERPEDSVNVKLTWAGS